MDASQGRWNWGWGTKCASPFPTVATGHRPLHKAGGLPGPSVPGQVREGMWTEGGWEVRQPGALPEPPMGRSTWKPQSCPYTMQVMTPEEQPVWGGKVKKQEVLWFCKHACFGGSMGSTVTECPEGSTGTTPCCPAILPSAEAQPQSPRDFCTICLAIL